MKKQRCVVLYGNSLFMAGVEASLKDRPDWKVIRVDTALDNAREQLRQLRPDVVIFNMDTPHEQFVLSFLKEHPGLPLLGLGLTSDTVVVFSSQPYKVLTVADLTRVIQNQTEGH